MTCLTFTDRSAQEAQGREIARLSDVQTEQMADLRGAQADLIEQATHDALTGLPNRALLVDRIDQALHHAERSGRCIAVIFVDLDRFKVVNDTDGHAAGDAVLVRVALGLNEAVRPMDTVARIGGDEFVVFAADVDNDAHAVDLSTRLLAELTRPAGRAEDARRVTASVGVSVSAGGRGTAEGLIHEADTAMYRAKALGGDCVEIFDDALDSQVRQRVAAQQTIQAALDEHRVIAYYQPIVDLASGHLAGFEALARIAEPDGSVLSPAAFIAAAEDSGLVIPLGAQVLGLACGEAGGWGPAGAGRRLTIAVNVSPRQFRHGNLPTLVGRVLEMSGLDPMDLHLELTETAIIDLRTEILEQLARIRDLGVEIGLDDFGTGYASLRHLRRLPLTFVKIDQSFVQGLWTVKEDERIVAAVVGLAADLGLRSIAEGVETHDQLTHLRELGCDQAQGYLFAHPLPPGDVAGLSGHPAW